MVLVHVVDHAGFGRDQRIAVRAGQHQFVFAQRMDGVETAHQVPLGRGNSIDGEIRKTGGLRGLRVARHDTVPMARVGTRRRGAEHGQSRAVQSQVGVRRTVDQKRYPGIG